jgi:pimeloyl-ACP methyl ester carboxylesterase
MTRTLLLLHGLGATAAAWNAVRREIEQRSLGESFAPDLSGHGASAWQREYTVGAYAAEVAALVRGKGDVFVIGHSLGAYIGLALASRWFGVEVAGVVGIGPKITWSEADLKGARELADRPIRWYATAEEASARYRRVAGLDAGVASGEEWLARGIVQGEEGLAAGAGSADLRRGGRTVRFDREECPSACDPRARRTRCDGIDGGTARACC